MQQRIVRSPQEDDRLVKLLAGGWTVNRIEKAILIRRSRIGPASKWKRWLTTRQEHILQDDEICEYLIVLEHPGRVK